MIGRITHSVKAEPSSLQPSNVASKKLVRRKSHATNADAVCVEELKRQPWNVHRSNSAPDVVTSVRSTSVKVHSTYCAAARSSAYQSSPRRCSPSAPDRPQTWNVPPLRQ